MFKPGLSENSIQGQMLSRFTETELCQNEARGIKLTVNSPSSGTCVRIANYQHT